VIQDRLGITPIELESGHCIALSQPGKLAAILDGAGSPAT
jgi:hypothetical protein